MSRATVLAAGRRAAEAGMTDTCTITRRTGTTDPVTGVPSTSDTPLYDGVCRVQAARAEAQRQDIGEDHELLLRLEIQLPVAGTEGLQVGDIVTITAAVNDADLTGRVFRIRDLAHKSEATARRVQVIEVTG
jgi:hypothetical protein